MARRVASRQQQQHDSRSVQQVVEEQGRLFLQQTHIETFLHELPNSLAYAPTLDANAYPAAKIALHDVFVGFLHITYHFAVILLHRHYVLHPFPETDVNLQTYATSATLRCVGIQYYSDCRLVARVQSGQSPCISNPRRAAHDPLSRYRGHSTQARGTDADGRPSPGSRQAAIANITSSPASTGLRVTCGRVSFRCTRSGIDAAVRATGCGEGRGVSACALLYLVRG